MSRVSGILTLVIAAAFAFASAAKFSGGYQVGYGTGELSYWSVAFAELILALCLCVPRLRLGALVASCAVASLFASVSLWGGIDQPCGCLGAIKVSNATRAAVSAITGLLCCLALWLLCDSKTKRGLNGLSPETGE
ncbi:MAG: hypothetical protein ACI9SE_003884 [Neolewinella sp.]|jgi:hypothetical protein